MASEGQVSISLSGGDRKSDSGGLPDARRNHCAAPVGLRVTRQTPLLSVGVRATGCQCGLDRLKVDSNQKPEGSAGHPSDSSPSRNPMANVGLFDRRGSTQMVRLICAALPQESSACQVQLML